VIDRGSDVAAAPRIQGIPAGDVLHGVAGTDALDDRVRIGSSDPATTTATTRDEQILDAELVDEPPTASAAHPDDAAAPDDVTTLQAWQINEDGTRVEIDVELTEPAGPARQDPADTPTSAGVRPTYPEGAQEIDDIVAATTWRMEQPPNAAVIAPAAQTALADAADRLAGALPTTAADAVVASGGGAGQQPQGQRSAADDPAKMVEELDRVTERALALNQPGGRSTATQTPGRPG
jgi:hypothetical protein